MGSKRAGVILRTVTIQGGIYGTTTSEFNLRIYADADWATNSEDRLSRSGSVSQLGDSTIWWKSRKQTSIAASSCEAEYMALFESAKDAIWLRNLLCEFGFCPGPAPTTIFHDNQGSIVWAKEDSLRKVKHVALRYHFTHNLINAGQIELTYVESKANRADSLTKPLSGSQFSDSKKVLGVRNWAGVLIYERENKLCFSLELSHIQFINYSLHIVDRFHISCHDISIVITSLETRTNTHLLHYYVSCLVVDYCMCLQTLDSNLASVTIMRHL